MVRSPKRFWHIAFLVVVAYVGLFGSAVVYVNFFEHPESDNIRIVAAAPSVGLCASVWVWNHLHWVLPILMLSNVLAAVGFWLRSEDRPAAFWINVYGALQSLMLILGFITTCIVVSNNRLGCLTSTPAGDIPKSLADGLVFVAYSLPLLLLAARGGWILVTKVAQGRQVQGVV